MYINEKIYDEAKRKNVYRRKCVGHVDPKSGKILPNRPKRESHSTSVESVGINILFSKLASDIGLMHSLQIAFSRGWRLILTCAIYCAVKNEPLTNITGWSTRNGNPFGNRVKTEDIAALFSSMESNAIDSFLKIWYRKVGDHDALILPVRSMDNYMRRPGEAKYGIKLSNDSFASDYEICFGRNTGLPIAYIYHAVPPSSLGEVFSANSRFLWLDMESYTYMPSPDVVSRDGLDKLIDSDEKYIAEIPNTMDLVKETVRKYHKSVFEDQHQNESGGSGRMYASMDIENKGRTVHQHMYYDAILEEAESSAFMNLIDKCKRELESGNIVVPHNLIYNQYFVAKTDDNGDAFIDLDPNRIMYSMEGAGFKIVLSNTIDDPIEAAKWSDVCADANYFYDNTRNTVDNSDLKLYLAPYGAKRDFIQFVALILREALRERLMRSGLSQTYSMREVLDAMSSVHIVRTDNRKGAVMSELDDDQRLFFDVLDLSKSV